ncbi:putative caspase-like protein [Bradyrhizobium sp. GM0.4]
MHLEASDEVCRRALFSIVLAGTSSQLASAADRRIALVVGVSHYKHVPVLANPTNDAQAMALALGRLGFDVEVALDPDRASLETAIRRLGQRSQVADASLFYYAGHALEVNGQNLLVPASANIQSAQDLRFETVDLDSVLDGIAGRSKISLLFMDSCRDNPFAKRLVVGSRSISRSGLASIDSAAGTLIAFSTAPGRVAEDGNTDHSPFTKALLNNIEQPGVEVRRMMSNVRREVREATGGQQVPWENSALEGEFYFKPLEPAPPQPAPTSSPNTTQTVAALSASSALIEVLSVGLPNRPPQYVQTTAQRYVAAPPNKAQAVASAASSTWYVYGRDSSDQAEQAVLEGCQIRFNEPCMLVAVNDKVPAPSEQSTWARRTMSRVEYSGPFSPYQIPAILPNGPASQAAKSYVAAPSAKAAAIHPWGRLFFRTNAPSQLQAELDALKQCNDDPDRKGRDGPCFLYAVANRVVLPMRMTAPHQPANTIAQATALVTDAGAAKTFSGLRTEKALTVEPDSGGYYYWDGASSKDAAERSALIGCQLAFSKPCVLLAGNDTLLAADPFVAQRHDMPELRYKGRFQPEATPLLAAGNQKIPFEYSRLPAPKALAIRPQRAKMASATGSTAAEAEQKALASCNDDLRWPCFLYAVGDEVVISDRRKEASK